MLLKLLMLFTLLGQAHSIWRCKGPPARSTTTAASTTTKPTPPFSCPRQRLLPEPICSWAKAPEFLAWEAVAHRSPRRNFTKIRWSGLGLADYQRLGDNVTVQLGLVSRPSSFNSYRLETFNDWLQHNETRLVIRNFQCALCDFDIRYNVQIDGMDFRARNETMVLVQTDTVDKVYFQVRAKCGDLEMRFPVFKNDTAPVTFDSRRCNHQLGQDNPFRQDGHCNP